MRDTFVQIFKDNKPEANFNSDPLQGDEKQLASKFIVQFVLATMNCHFYSSTAVAKLNCKVIFSFDSNDTCRERHGVSFLK